MAEPGRLRRQRIRCEGLSRGVRGLGGGVCKQVALLAGAARFQRVYPLARRDRRPMSRHQGQVERGGVTTRGDQFERESYRSVGSGQRREREDQGASRFADGYRGEATWRREKPVRIWGLASTPLRCQHGRRTRGHCSEICFGTTRNHRLGGRAGEHQLIHR